MSVSVTSAESGRSEIRDHLARGRLSFSFEFFPPKNDEGERTLAATLRELERLSPTFVSVTYGAGGSTRDRTIRITSEIAANTSMTPVAHLTCVDHSIDELRQIIRSYAEAGIRNVLALRGDPADGPGAPWVPHPEGLNHANQLVELVRETGDFCVGVAAFPDVHPASADLDQEAWCLKLKQDAGADYAATQFFFGADDYFRLRDRAESVGCTLPIIPGIMPVTNVRSIRRMAELCGADLPNWLTERLHAVQDEPEAVRAVGIEVATDLALRLLAGGAPGLHFYTLNRSTATREIFRNVAEAGYVESSPESTPEPTPESTSEAAPAVTSEATRAAPSSS